ncbi:HNH endonuclease [Streptomyces melanosporofaciens]
MSSREDLTVEERAFIHCNLKDRDGARCFYCRRNLRSKGRRRKTIDHYIPYRLWPAWELENLVLACEACNLRKADALPLTLAWLLLRTVDQSQALYSPAA